MRSSDRLISSWSPYSRTYPSFSGRSQKGAIDLVTQNKTGSLTLTRLRKGELKMVFQKNLLCTKSTEGTFNTTNEQVSHFYKTYLCLLLARKWNM